jgi:hypothetical protein
MSKVIRNAVWAFGLMAVGAMAAIIASVTPVTFEAEWYRLESGEAFAANNGEVATYDTQVLFTNIVLYDEGTNAYGSTNLTVTVRIGNAEEGYVGYDANYYSGNTSWYWYAVIPSSITGTCYVQPQITDTNGNTFVFPRKSITGADLFATEL